MSKTVVLFCLVVLLCVSTHAVLGANILVFMPMPFKSHFRGFQPLFEELSRRGHNVTVVSSFPLDRPVVNYTDIGPFYHEERVRNVMELVHMNFVTSVPLKWRLGEQMSDTVMSHETMKEFIRSNASAAAGSFDLVMVESFCQEYTVAVGHKFHAPVVNLAPAMIWTSVSKWLHVPSTFSYLPDLCLKSSNTMNFAERVQNTITGLMQLYAEDYEYLPRMKAVMDEYMAYEGWRSRPSLERMLNNVSLTLVNSHYALGVPRPYLPGVVEVGGMHIEEPKSLPENIQSFINSAKDGVIICSFGTVVDLNDIPEEKFNIFLNVFGRLKQKVILKWVPRANSSVNLSRNIMTGSWFPQNDILAHSNVRLFITHGGLHSLEETIFNAKPVVGIPFFADQYFNMKSAEEKGFGKMVNFFEMTEGSFENAVKEVLSNPEFKEQANIHSEIYKDQPMKPLDKAIYWIEYVIRNGGANHLISTSIGLNDLQYFLVDISSILLISTVLITYLCYLFIVKLIFKN